LLGDHFYNDGSYVFVVDSKGHIIYHAETDRIDEDVSGNTVVRKLMNRESGAAQVVNSQGIDMLAGYSYVPTSGWGIVSQRPTAAALTANVQMIQQMFIQTSPILLLAIIIIFLISHFIATPLQKLASLTEASTVSNQRNHFNGVRAWYYEAIQLKRVLTNSLDFWQDKVDHITLESHTDPLTKLTNRRTMDKLINQWMNDGEAFSLIVVDIDHFKRINDTYGHGVGDQVLIYLAETMKAAVVAENGVCCRYGGEEFVVLLPGDFGEEAFHIAERLRQSVSEQVSPCGDVITVSAGIADSKERLRAEELFDLADQRLYEAKNSGRNRSVYHFHT
jgi:diguanylate cyclase (GGDEF)-like protein